MTARLTACIADQRMFKKRDLITAHRDKTQQLRTMQSKLSSIQRLLFVLKVRVIASFAQTTKAPSSIVSNNN